MTASIEKVMTLVAGGETISKALSKVYVKRKVTIAFDDKDFDIPLTETNMTNRTVNALLRNQIRTLNDFINVVSKNDYRTLKGFGHYCATEVYEKILDIAWEQMDTVEKAKFLLRTDAVNKRK